MASAVYEIKVAMTQVAYPCHTPIDRDLTALHFESNIRQSMSLGLSTDFGYFLSTYTAKFDGPEFKLLPSLCSTHFHMHTNFAPHPHSPTTTHT